MTPPDAPDNDGPDHDAPGSRQEPGHTQPGNLSSRETRQQDDTAEHADDAPAQGDGTVDDTASSLGGYMAIGFWLLLLGFGSLGASRWLENRYNPNAAPVSQFHDGQIEVQLQADRRGHYITTGHINGQPVTFLLDTGASGISIPAGVAERLQLKRGLPFWVSTAAGDARVYQTSLASAGIGDLVQRDIKASINPHMDDELILLGMRWLRHYELLQQGDTLTITSSN